MVDKEIIPHLKSCCLSLGLMPPGIPVPLVIGGTGFIVNDEGFLVTADNVVTFLEEQSKKLKVEDTYCQYDRMSSSFLTATSDKSPIVYKETDLFIYSNYSFIYTEYFRFTR